MASSYSSRDNTEHLARRRALYQKYKAAGVCVMCGRERAPASVLCPKDLAVAVAQREAKRLRENARYYARKAAGVCGHCGKPFEAGSLICRPCRARAAARAERLLRDKQCVACGAPSGARRLCPACRNKRSWTTEEHIARGGCRCGFGWPVPGKKSCQMCLDHGRAKIRRQKIDALAAYGGPRCVCCGETQFEFLQIDHTDNNGAAHRRQVGRENMYIWLKRHAYPPGFQVLCANCNFAKGAYGECPHQRKE